MTDATTPDALPALPDTFNFAQHLLSVNAARADKAAFIDDHGSLTYGQLQERVQRVAAGLRSLGLRREERVLLLMQDTTDWPVAFLGAIYAGVVPVASRPTFIGWKPSTSLSTAMVSSTFAMSICAGRGSWTRMPWTFSSAFSSSIRLSSASLVMSAG